MDVVMLSRLQFAAATMFHFLFVPLALGLSVLVYGLLGIAGFYLITDFAKKGPVPAVAGNRLAIG